MSSAAQMSVQDRFAEVGHIPQKREVAQKRQVTGIHLGHNAAAALVEDGRLIFAMQEERLSRVKNQGGLPVLTLDYIGGLASKSEKQILNDLEKIIIADQKGLLEKAGKKIGEIENKKATMKVVLSAPDPD